MPKILIQNYNRDNSKEKKNLLSFNVYLMEKNKIENITYCLNRPFFQNLIIFF